MDFKSMAIASTLAGSVLLTGLTFSGTINLDDIKSKGLDWANKVETSVTGSKDMLAKFNLFKSDVTAQLNSKIAHINDLNDKIADLNSKVGSGQVSLDSANTEIGRLNTELQKANDEVQALKDQYDLTDADVQQAYSQMATASDMDTTVTTDTQNPDVTPVDTTTTDTSTTTTDTGTTTTSGSTTDTGTTTTTTSAYATQEQAIHDNILASYPYITNLTVAVTDTTVTMTSSNNFSGYSADTFVSQVNSGLSGKTVNNWTTSANTITYTLK